MAQVNYLGLFPFCPTETTDSSLVGNGTSHPLGLTLNELIYFYWKIKQISVTYSETISVSGSTYYGSGFNPFVSDPALSAGSDSNTFNIDPSPLPSSEIDLVCGVSYNGVLNYISVSINFSATYIYNNLYYPNIVINSRAHSSLIYKTIYGDINQTIAAINSRLSIYLPPASISYSDPGSTCSIDLFGTSAKTIPLYLNGINMNSDEFQEYALFFNGCFYFNNYTQVNNAYGFSASASLSISLTSSETWPYNP